MKLGGTMAPMGPQVDPPLCVTQRKKLRKKTLKKYMHV